MKVTVVRQEPTPPPIEKVVIELTAEEAMEWAGGFALPWEIARQIREALVT
jgi:hypothetical protein